MNNTKIIEKIGSQCESLQKKIAGLSNNYLTNTAKRQREQKNRDSIKEELRQRLELLLFFKSEASNRSLTMFEHALLTGTFYDEIRRLLICRKYDDEYPANSVTLVQFDKIDEQYRKMLVKIGVNNTNELCGILEQFEKIQQQAVTPADPQTVILRDLVFKARLSQQGDIQFTPDLLAEHMVSLAGITPESRVLEPEAGIGNIADKAKKITPNVDCIEISADFREILELKGYNLAARDLFDYEHQPIYDAVIMNPPFSKEVEHIKYAFGFVKPGGCLVAVCSTRFRFIQNRGYPEFREWLEQHNLYCEEIIEKFEMTGTNAVLLRITK